MSQSTLWKYEDENDLDGYILIIPSVAVGNVAQLACDLLISSLRMKKIASIYSRALIPVLGHDPYDLDSDRLSTSCELYMCSKNRVAVMQFRAPLVHKHAQSFLEDVVTTFRKKNITNLIILTSSFAHVKKQIQSSSFRYMASEMCSYNNIIEDLDWTKHDSSDNGVMVYGGGFASLLYSISAENSIPCLLLYKYCSEGDNIPDAYDMILYLEPVLSLFDKETDLSAQLTQPVSWKLLFGRPPPVEMY